MKIFSSLFLIALIFFGCDKCKRLDSYSEDNGKLKVLTTIAMIGDIVKNIGQEHVDCAVLIRGDLDPHTYELVKGDDEKFARADLIFYNGLGLEHGLTLREQLQGEPKAIGVGNWILSKEPALILSVGENYDPHIWMDISLWARTIDPIVEALCQKDPLHAPLFQKRALNLKQQMHDFDQKTYTKLQGIPPSKRYLVTSHNAFHYFTRRYLATEEECQNATWKMRSQAPEGVAPDAALSVHDIAAVVDYVDKLDIKVIFAESNINQDALDKIVDVSKQKGHLLRLAEGTLLADAMGSADSYLNMIAHNVDVICKELMYD